jgi:hypothetical protein
MPVVLRVGGFAFGIYPGDHDPPHVHVRYSGRKCKIVLSTLKISNSDMNRSEEGSVVRMVAEHWEALTTAWVEIRQQKSEGR